MANDEQYTPEWVFDGLGVRFDLDVCSPKDHVTAVPADRKYTIDDDGLVQDWSGFVWMNPPYSDSTLWIDKFIGHSDGICLTQISKSKWFQKLWDNSDAMMLLPYNMKFVLADGSLNPIYMPTMISGMGSKAVEAINNFSLTRVR